MRKSTGVVAARFLVRAGLLVLLPALSRAALAESGYYHHSRSGGRKTTEEVCTADDALDGSQPQARALTAMNERITAVTAEYHGSQHVCHEVNEEVSLVAKFHKTLPHNNLGQVDEVAFAALEECISSGNFEVCEAVPAGDPNGFLVNPLGGIPVDMAGPSGSAVLLKPAPQLASAIFAGHLAECYWMSLARDVPFSEYGENELTIAAAENLSDMPGFPLEENHVAMNEDGSIDPQKHLFRPNFVGIDKGPLVSQLLMSDFTMDSITSSPKASTFVPGVNFMTDWDSWLHIQNGGAKDSPEELDPTPRYIRNARDLARMVVTDTIYTEAFRGTMVLLEKGAISGDGFNGPYRSSSRQKGFVQYGLSHIMRMLGGCEGSQRASFFQKWNVHLVARPEAVGGVVHNILNGNMDRSLLDESLLDNSGLLDRVATANAAQNEANGVPGSTYLLSQAVKDGSPAHPSYPAGHAVQNGAFATAIKAYVGLERGIRCFPNPHISSVDGLELEAYLPSADETCIAEDGTEKHGVTYEGEINKLAANVAFGRQMVGVHYRFDSTEGMILGETITVRMFQQEVESFPEKDPYQFRLFHGDVVQLNPNGSFLINGKLCAGPVYTGADNC